MLIRLPSITARSLTLFVALSVIFTGTARAACPGPERLSPGLLAAIEARPLSLHRVIVRTAVRPTVATLAAVIRPGGTVTAVFAGDPGYAALLTPLAIRRAAALPSTVRVLLDRPVGNQANGFPGAAYLSDVIARLEWCTSRPAAPGVPGLVLGSDPDGMEPEAWDLVERAARRARAAGVPVRFAGEGGRESGSPEPGATGLAGEPPDPRPDLRRVVVLRSVLWGNSVGHLSPQ